MPSDLDRLRAQLLASGIQRTNNALFQVIDRIITELRNTSNTATTAQTTSGGVSSTLSALTLITDTDQSASLPNSRRLIAGDNVSFDNSVANQKTIDVTIPPERVWSVLSDGDLIEPELIYASGEVIMTHVP